MNFELIARKKLASEIIQNIVTGATDIQSGIISIDKAMENMDIPDNVINNIYKNYDNYIIDVDIKLKDGNHRHLQYKLMQKYGNIIYEAIDDAAEGFKESIKDKLEYMPVRMQDDTQMMFRDESERFYSPIYIENIENEAIVDSMGNMYVPGKWSYINTGRDFEWQRPTDISGGGKMENNIFVEKAILNYKYLDSSENAKNGIIHTTNRSTAFDRVYSSEDGTESIRAGNGKILSLKVNSTGSYTGKQSNTIVDIDISNLIFVTEDDYILRQSPINDDSIRVKVMLSYNAEGEIYKTTPYIWHKEEARHSYFKKSGIYMNEISDMLEEKRKHILDIETLNPSGPNWKIGDAIKYKDNAVGFKKIIGFFTIDDEINVNNIVWNMEYNNTPSEKIARNIIERIPQIEENSNIAYAIPKQWINPDGMIEIPEDTEDRIKIVLNQIRARKIVTITSIKTTPVKLNMGPERSETGGIVKAGELEYGDIMPTLKDSKKYRQEILKRLTDKDMDTTNLCVTNAPGEIPQTEGHSGFERKVGNVIREYETSEDDDEDKEYVDKYKISKITADLDNAANIDKYILYTMKDIEDDKDA